MSAGSLFKVISLMLVAATLPAFASVNIDTTSAWDGTSFISTFGIPNTQTYGQVIQFQPG